LIHVFYKEEGVIFHKLFNSQRGNQLLFFLIIAVISLAAVFRELFFKVASGLGKCVFLKYFGFKCYACGCTRATFKLLQGDLAGAFYMNPLYIAVLFVAVVIFIRFGINAFGRNYKPFVVGIKPWQLVLLGIVLLVFSIVRNLPFYLRYFY